ncbi:MAG: energy-coupling factor transporter ATPase [Oscillibacter sp.]|jgi:energy-coupling factor transport system ATP-binding protein|nr:energy-coupling factor transporter ATPase [Oscillibacter sp.]
MMNTQEAVKSAPDLLIKPLENNGKVVLRTSNLSFSYPDVEVKAIDNVNFEVKQGEFVLLCGSSGSGKTTLAKCLNGIIPHLSNGSMYGDVFIDGVNTTDAEIYELSSRIGMVFQNPEDQIFSTRVSDEVALGVECQGHKHDDIVQRVNYAMDKLRITDIAHRLTFSLSGGQRQKVSIASCLAVLPSIIVLDDPTTDLDPISKQEVMDILEELKNEINMTFFVIEHDLTDLVEFTDHMLVMHEGRILYDGDPGEILYEHYDELDSIGIRIPDHVRLAKYLMDQGYTYKVKHPLRQSEVIEFTEQVLAAHDNVFPKLTYRDYTRRSDEKVAQVQDVTFQYPATAAPQLEHVSFDVYKGEFLAIIGHNGSGKTTVMKNMLGLLKPCSGDVTINGLNTKNTEVSRLILDIGYVFQNPDNQLFCNTVREEVGFGLENSGADPKVIQENVDRVLDIVGLKDEQDAHPFSLSRGERQRLAVATMLVSNPKIIMLDEPTTGLDERDLHGILSLMEELIEFHDGTVIMVTHDMEVVARYATRIIVMGGGKLILDDTPDEIFKNHYDELSSLKLKPTIIASLSRRIHSDKMPYIPYWKFFESQLKSQR